MKFPQGLAAFLCRQHFLFLIDCSLRNSFGFEWLIDMYLSFSLMILLVELGFLRLSGGFDLSFEALSALFLCVASSATFASALQLVAYLLLLHTLSSIHIFVLLAVSDLQW